MFARRATGLRSFAAAVAMATLCATSLTMVGAGAGSAGAAGDPVVAAAGDIACDPNQSTFNGGRGTSSSCRQLSVSNILLSRNFAAVLALGDTQYFCGSLWSFEHSYEVSWGRVKSITHPAVGNHEYLTAGAPDCSGENAGATGYFEYFGPAAGSPSKGYYSYDVGAWHVIARNSSCAAAGGCGATSPQGRWLSQDLAAHRNVCTLAYWHIPLFSSGGRASAGTLAFWQLLYAAHADVVLDGHDHIYERFAPQLPNGTSSPNGIRQFTVGTGGSNHTAIAAVAANSVVRNATSFGVLELTLHATSYSWKFVPANGSFTDSGSAACRP